MTMSDGNLISLCQRCHFIADLPSHIVNARIARLKKRRERIAQSGQLELL